MTYVVLKLPAKLEFMHIENRISVGKDGLQYSCFGDRMVAKELSAMICSYCDSLFQKLPEGGICPNCNAPLAEAVKPKLPKPPIGVYKQGFGFMELQEQGVRFYESYRGDIIDRYIPYEEIYAVNFVPARKLLGFLSVR